MAAHLSSLDYFVQKMFYLQFLREEEGEIKSHPNQIYRISGLCNLHLMPKTHQVAVKLHFEFIFLKKAAFSMKITIT